MGVLIFRKSNGTIVDVETITKSTCYTFDDTEREYPSYAINFNFLDGGKLHNTSYIFQDKDDANTFYDYVEKRIKDSNNPYVTAGELLSFILKTDLCWIEKDDFYE